MSGKNKILLVIYCLIFLTNCKKTKTNNPLQGIWVEETLRKDTLYFTSNNLIDSTSLYFELKAKPFIDSSISLINPLYNSANYSYRLIPDSISILSLFSSSGIYHNYYFKMDNQNNKLNIGKFYFRSSLPNNLTFIKL